MEPRPRAGSYREKEFSLYMRRNFPKRLERLKIERATL